MARNAFFTIWQYYPDWRSKLAIIRQLVRHTIEIGLFGTRKLARLRMIFQGLRDAFAGTLGVRYLPVGKPQAGVEPEFVAQASENL